MFNIPVQLNPSPAYPGLHVQGDFADAALHDELRLQPGVLLGGLPVTVSSTTGHLTDCCCNCALVTEADALEACDGRTFPTCVQMLKLICKIYFQLPTTTLYTNTCHVI